MSLLTSTKFYGSGRKMSSFFRLLARIIQTYGERFPARRKDPGYMTVRLCGLLPISWYRVLLGAVTTELHERPIILARAGVPLAGQEKR